MSFHWHPNELVQIGKYLAKWTALGILIGVPAGCASAAFLVSLEFATNTRETHPWLLYLLPLGGLLVGAFYHFFGRGLESGNNLILDEIHDPKSRIPGKLAPIIFLGTVATHLFGGSAGREGTAVQMGGSIAAWIGARLRLDAITVRILLMAGISAGFGSVFGTPIAGLVFGLEVLAVGRMRYDALVPCLVASVVADWTCTAWGVKHAHYVVPAIPPIDALLIGKVVLASLGFGAASIVFGELTHALISVFKKRIPWPMVRPFIGGLIVIGMTVLAGTDDYLGLSLPLIARSFGNVGVVPWAFALKLLFTAVTLGSGFKGGEVTPLFCIGATLGYTLGRLLGVPPEFMAALGFVAVFAGCANTPLACTVMGIELFGASLAVPLAVACCFTYIMTGHRGIYLSQRIDTPKHDFPHEADVSLGSIRSQSPLLLTEIKK